MEKHIHYFDHLRLIAAISVIYMHVASDPLRAEITTDWHFINIFTCIGFIAVPLFFMMSGYLLLSNQKTEDIDVLFKKRLPKLLIPLIGWTIVAILWIFLNEKSFSGAVEKLIGALNTPAFIHFWYVYTLIAVYVVSPILCAALRALNKKAHILVFFLAVLPSIQYILQVLLPASVDRFVNIDLISKITIFGGHLNTFILGYFLGNLKKKIPNWVLIVSGGMLIALISFGTFFLTQRNGFFDQTFQVQSQGFEVLLASIIFIFFKQNFNRPCKFYENVPVIPLAFSIYFMHNILLSMMATVMTSLFPITTFIGTVFVTLLNFFICFVVMKTVATIKPICYLATGIPFDTACKTCNWIYTYKKITNRTSK